jgi:hypothetical protein
MNLSRVLCAAAFVGVLTIAIVALTSPPDGRVATDTRAFLEAAAQDHR